MNLTTHPASLWRAAARVLLPLLLAPAAFAANWYVATTGSDTNAGTLAAPFATVMRAQTAAASGDTVYIRGGTYNTFTIAFTDTNYNYVHRLSKSGVTWSNYPGETPVFDFSSVPTNLRVCGFHVTGGNITIIGFNVTGTKVGAQKQSENYRIDGSAASCDFYYCVTHDTEANGFYFTNHAGGSCNYCDSYNNIGPTSDSIGNTDGFGAHGRAVAFRYCRSWHNSDDGYDCISTDQGASHTFDHCWAYNMTAGGDSNGFKCGGYGSGTVPATVPVHTVTYCLAANNAAHGFYANHQPGQAAVWTHNSSYNNSAGNFDMLERVSVTDATDIPGYREVLHFNLAFQGTAIRDDATPAANATNNSWTMPGAPAASDFLSVDATQMVQPRVAGLMPFINFMHLTSGSAYNGLGCFDPAPSAPTGASAQWITGSRVDLAWSAPAGAATYNIKRALSPGGPYTYIATGVTGTTFSDTTVSSGTTTYYYAVAAMSATSYDESTNSNQASAVQGPSTTVNSVSPDNGRSGTDAITNVAGLTILGKASAGLSDIAVYDSGAALGTTTADGSGNWAFNYSGTSLSDGTHSITAIATVSGVSGVESPSLQVVVDTIAPAAPTMSVNGSGPFNFVGTAEPNAIVTVTQAGSGPVASALADASGNWSASTSGAVPPGIYTFSAAATDVAGNTGPSSAPAVINTSIAAPVFTGIVSDTGVSNSDQVTNDSSLLLNGTAVAGATVTVSRAGTGVIGSTSVSAGGTWSFDYTGTSLPAGTYSFSAIATVGAASSPQSVPFTVLIDTSAPAIATIARQNPTAAAISPTTPSVVFRATFSEPVYGVTPASFALSTSGTATGTVASVSASSGTTIDVTVNGLSGEGTLRLDVPAGGNGLTDLAGNPFGAAFTGGDSYTRTSTGNGTWIRTATGGLWSDTANWASTIIADGAANTGDFSTIDISGTNTVHLDSSRTLNRLVFGDTVTTSAGSWLVDATGGSTLTLANSGPRITVNALGTGATTTITAPLAGNGGLAKDGAGTLVLGANNSLSGALGLTAGTLQIPAGGRLAMTAASTMSGASTLAVNGGTFTSTAGIGITSANVTVSSGGSVSLGAALNLNSNKDGNITVSGGTFTAPDLNIQRSSDGTINFAFGFIASGGVTNLGTLEVGSLNSNGFASIEGGAVNVTGAVTVGSQTTGGRGGQIRVINGSLSVADVTNGLILAKTNGANANNVTTAAFSGGTATLGKLTLGFDSTVTAGSAAVTISGGTVYLGSGGIVKNGTSGLVSSITASSGTLGAAADWATTQPIAISGATTLKAADAANNPFNFSLGGIVSGAGAITKTGSGTVTLSAANTSTGSITVNAGTLNVTGSLAATGTVTVNNTGTLAGTGTTNKAVTLNTGGTVSPAGAVIGTLTGTALTWNDGGVFAADLDGNGNSDRLVLSGALTRGTAGTFRFAFTPTVGLAGGNVYTLATFASTTFTAADFSYSGLPAGFAGAFSIVSNQLRFTIIVPPVITSAASAGGVYGSPFSYQIAATNGPGSFSASDLPPGLGIDPLSGLVAGTPTAAGSFTMTVGATNAAGTGTAPVVVNIAPAPAGVLLGNLSATYDGAPHAAGFTTTPAGLAVNLTYNGSSTPPTSAGSYNVVATIANPNFVGGTTGTLVIGKAAAGVTLGSLAQTYNGSPRVATATTSPTGLDVQFTYDGNPTPPTNAGSYAVVATIQDQNYAGSASGTLVVGKATATITLGALAQTYDGAPKVATATTTPAGLTVHLTYDGNSAAPSAAGSYAVAASIDDQNYSGTTTGTLVIAKATATVALSGLAQTYDGTPKSAGATTTPAGLTVQLTYEGGATAPTHAGSYAVVGTINDANYAGTATDTLVIAKAAATVTLDSLAQTYDGTPRVATATTVPASLVVQLTYDGSTTAPTNAGSYAVVATIAEQDYSGTANGTLVVSPANAPVTLAGLTQPYDGTPREVTATTNPVGLTVDITYDGNAAAPTLPGSYAVVATINDANRSGSASGTLTVTVTALVRHAPALSGDIDGSLQLLTGESFGLNGNNYVLGDLLVPGTPAVVLNGHPQLSGTQDANGAGTPSAYTVTLNGNSVARYVIRRVDPITMPVVTAPQVSTGTRDVTVNTAGQDIGNFATVRNLTLNNNAGNRAVPAGAYGNLTANGSSSLILGVVGATDPSVYDVQQLTLNGNATLRIVGPVVLKLANGLTLGNLAGAADHPEWLDLRIYNGGVTLNGSATLNGIVTAPNGTVSISGGATLNGRVSADRLTVNGNGVLSDPAF